MAQNTSLQFASLSSSLYVLNDESPPEFVQLDESKYCCVECTRLLREPMQTECGHRMCKVCVEEKLENTQETSEDGERGFPCPAKEEDCAFITKDGINPDFSVMREINQQQVYCRNRSRGCEIVLILRRLKAHLLECQYKAIPCKYAEMGCIADISAKEFDEHVAHCEYEPSPCHHCNQNIPKILIQVHIASQCPDVLVDCPQGCGTKNIRRAMLEDHKKNCPSVCKYYSMGCMEKGSIDHLKQHETKDASQHIDLLMVYLAQMKLDNAKLRDSCISVTEELDRMSTVVSEKNSEIESLNRQLGMMQTQLDNHMESNNQQLKAYMSRMQALEVQLQGLDAMSKDISVLRQHQAQIDNSLKELNASSRSAAASVNLPATVEAQFQEQGTAIQDHALQLDRLSLRMQCAETTSYDGVLVWKIAEVSRRRKEAREGKMVSLYSQPFYTSKFGYKMCARLYLNGDGVGRGTHVSLFFVLMKGEFDGILTWPFRNRVTLQLLNQKDQKNHLVDSFRPDITSSSFQKPVSNLNVASGCPLFASHARLDEDDTFVRNDSIFIKIIVELSDMG